MQRTDLLIFRFEDVSDFQVAPRCPPRSSAFLLSPRLPIHPTFPGVDPLPGALGGGAGDDLFEMELSVDGSVDGGVGIDIVGTDLLSPAVLFLGVDDAFEGDNVFEVDVFLVGGKCSPAGRQTALSILTHIR